MKKYMNEELFEMDAVEVYKLVLRRNEVKKFPNGFWQQPEAKSNAIKCIKWLVEDSLRLTDEDLKKQISVSFFKDNKLETMLNICFKCSPVNAIQEVYPNKFKIWEFNKVPKGYWTVETGIIATKWLVGEKLKLSEKELKEQLSKKLFESNGLGKMLCSCFDGSPFKAISTSYPEKDYKPWEFEMAPNSFWTDIKNGIDATRWMINKLKLTDEEIKDSLSTQLFEDNGLGGMLSGLFKGSPYKAIEATYPGKFKPWELQNVSSNFWRNEENAIDATRWLIDDKLKLTDIELKKCLSAETFRKNGLSGMLKQCFNNSPFKAINLAYPNKFKKEDFSNY